MDHQITVTELCDKLKETHGDTKLNGVLCVVWDQDNSIKGAYSGVPLNHIQLMELSLNGSRVLLQDMQHATAAAVESKPNLTIVDE